jgi:tripartite-type tricarboxylate transporter receptor subunit TctC
MQRRSVLWCAIGTALTTVGATAHAGPYPDRPITLYVAFAPGGAGDIVARLVAREMSQSMGQAVVIENRPTPNQAVATVAKAKPDGYTLVMTGNGTTLSSALFKSLPYDLLKDFTHVSTLAFFDLALIVSGQSDLSTVSDVLAWARVNPGKLNIGTVRLGSTQNLAAEMFKSMTGINAVIVPYRTTADILTALRAKDVAVAFEIVPPILGQIKSKTIKPLAVMSTSRFPDLPDVPTMVESGVQGFVVTSWNGISVPSNTPQPIVDRLAKALQAAVAAPDVKLGLQAVGMVARSSSSEQMTERVRSDIVKWRTVIEKAGIPRQ